MVHLFHPDILMIHDNRLPPVLNAILVRDNEFTKVNEYGLAVAQDIQCNETIFENELLKISNSNLVFMKHIRNDGSYVFLDNITYTVNRGTYREFFYFDSFTNHSCDPNVKHVYLTDTKYKAVALRDIKCGEQLTNDYSTFDTDNDATPFMCCCNSPLCKKYV